MILAVICAGLLAGVVYTVTKGKSGTQKKQEASAEAGADETESQSGIIEEDGKKYKLNPDIKTVLFMGVDKEEKADLGTNYAYKLENLEPNIKISTLEKIIDALNVDLQTFFDLTLKEESTDLAQLIDTIKSLPEYKQNKVISAINTIINETK